MEKLPLVSSAGFCDTYVLNCTTTSQKAPKTGHFCSIQILSELHFTSSANKQLPKSHSARRVHAPSGPRNQEASLDRSKSTRAG